MAHKNPKTLLNRRSELLNKCRHKEALCLKRYKKPKIDKAQNAGLTHDEDPQPYNNTPNLNEVNIAQDDRIVTDSETAPRMDHNEPEPVNTANLPTFESFGAGTINDKAPARALEARPRSPDLKPEDYSTTLTYHDHVLAETIYNIGEETECNIVQTPEKTMSGDIMAGGYNQLCVKEPRRRPITRSYKAGRSTTAIPDIPVRSSSQPHLGNGGELSFEGESDDKMNTVTMNRDQQTHSYGRYRFRKRNCRSWTRPQAK